MVSVGLSTKGIEFDWKEGGNPIKPPPAGLEPHGDSGWYHSPDVVDPRDCQFYPDSPWCGGNPIDLSVGVQAEINVDPCGITFDVSGQAGIKFPHRVETYRFPGKCRREYEATPPPPVPNISLSNHQELSGFNRSVASDEYVYAGVVTTELDYREISCGIGRPNAWVWYGRYSTGVTLAFGGSKTFTPQGNDEMPVEVYAQAVCTDLDYNRDAVCGISGGDTNSLSDPFVVEVDFNRYQDLNTYIITINDDGAIYSVYTVGGTQVEYYPDRQKLPHHTLYYHGWIFTRQELEIIYGKWADVQKYYQDRYRRVLEYNQGITYVYVCTCFDVLRPEATNPYKRNPPPPPPEPRNCDCMQCCVSSPQSQNQQNNDALLRQILAEVQKANKAIGSDILPATFPNKITGNSTGFVRLNSLAAILQKQTDYIDEAANKILDDVKKTNDGLGVDVLPIQVPGSIKPNNSIQLTMHNAVEFLNQLYLYIAELNQENLDLDKIKEVLGVDEFPAQFPARLTGSGATVNIANIPQLLKQQVLYSDELLGEYPIKIKIEDTDPTQEGNQSQTLEFGNTSEVLAEAFGAMMNVSLDTQVLVQLATKALIELGVTRKQLHTTQSMVDAICQHIGFASQEDTEDVPFTFTVPNYDNRNELTLEQFCKESTQKVEILKYKGKNTYMEDAAILRHMHGIIKGVFFRGIARDAIDVAGAIKNLVKKQSDTMDKIAVGSTDDLDNWAEDFEMGFSAYTGGTTARDPSKPYGLPLDQRPRIQIIRKPSAEPPTT